MLEGFGHGCRDSHADAALGQEPLILIDRGVGIASGMDAAPTIESPEIRHMKELVVREKDDDIERRLLFLSAFDMQETRLV